MRSSLHPSTKNVRRFLGLGLVSSWLLAAVPTSAGIIYDPFDYGVDDGSFRRCTTQILGLKVDPEVATTACSRAIRPEELGTCVERIGTGSSLAIADVLNACRKVRRPLELSNCVVDIRRQITGAETANVLGNCRRSLLPERYAKCVVGITTAAKLEVTPAMQRCLAAGDYYPPELEPTFIPY
jgi:hypothetical protein